LASALKGEHEEGMLGIQKENMVKTLENQDLEELKEPEANS
jgi:hypothetical protein